MPPAASAGARKFLTSLALLRALPWRKFKNGSTLVIELGGEVLSPTQILLSAQNRGHLMQQQCTDCLHGYIHEHL